MAKKKRPTYTLEFRREAARLALQGDIPVSQVARDLGVSETALRRWMDKTVANDGNGPLTTDERQELTRLRRELRNVKQERDFLKKVATFFAKEDS
jgi:transposase